MTVVYTAILGSCDSLKTAPRGADHCVCLTDHPEFSADPKGWQIGKWATTDNPRRDAWNLRAMSHVLFPEAETSIWIDASFTLTDLPRLLKHAGTADLAVLQHHKRSSCYEEGREIVRVGQASAADVNRQLDDYRREGFQPSGLSISCIVVRRHSEKVTDFNQRWWQETSSHPGDNTQLSLDYCAWKAGLTVKRLQGTRHQNPYAVHDHEDHKLRRRAYDTAVTR